MIEKLNANPIILFYDGQCGLCIASTRLFLSLDSNRKLMFAPLQGETARKLLPSNISIDLNTMILYKKGEIHTKSDAAIEALLSMGGIFSIFYLLKFIPRFIRDSVYDLISKNRIRWFGRFESCRVPTKEERDQFLD